MKALLILIVMASHGGKVALTSISQPLPTIAACNTALPMIQQDIAKAIATDLSRGGVIITTLTARCVRIE